MYCKQEITFCETAALKPFLEFFLLMKEHLKKKKRFQELINPSRKMSFNRVTLFLTTTHANFFFFN